MEIEKEKEELDMHFLSEFRYHRLLDETEFDEIISSLEWTILSDFNTGFRFEPNNKYYLSAYKDQLMNYNLYIQPYDREYKDETRIKLNLIYHIPTNELQQLPQKIEDAKFLINETERIINRVLHEKVTHFGFLMTAKAE